MWASASVLRLRPFDRSTAVGRSRERYRRIALATASVIAARAASAVSVLVSVPLTIRYLGHERYGMWMVISSLMILASCADLGLGNGLVNSVAAADGRADRHAMRSAISCSFFMVSSIAVFLLGAFAMVYAVVPWERLFNVSSHLAVEESGPAVAAFVICFALSLPLDLIQRVRMGQQEAHINYLWQCAGNLMGLAMVVLAVLCRAGLPTLVFALFGPPLLTMLINSCVHFGWQRPWLRPSWTSLDGTVARTLMRSGCAFLILQVFTLLGNATDNVVIAHVRGASAVAPYAVTQKLFMFALLAQAFVLPLWPAFGEAQARRDWKWARHALNRSLLVSVVLGVTLALPLVALGRAIIYQWAGPQLIPSQSLLVGFFAWVVLASYGGVMSSYLNSGPLLCQQTIFVALAALTSLCLKFLFVSIWDISGAIWATVVGYGLLYVLPAARLAYRAPVLSDGCVESSPRPPQLAECR